MQRLALLCALSLGPLAPSCAAPETPRPPAPDAPESARVPASAHVAGPDGSGPRVPHTTSASTAPAPAPALPKFTEFEFERVLDVDVNSIALGKPPKVAVLADSPYIYDGSQWQRRELPDALKAGTEERDDVEIFFGRDDQPRIMGSRFSSDEPTKSVYLRHRPHGWKTEPSELGPLAQSTAGLYGLLGYADPEVVCAPGAFCLIKRLSGWSRMPAKEQAVPLFQTRFGVYKADAGRLWLLVNDAWSVTLDATEFVPTDLCHETKDRLWASSASAGRVYLRPRSEAGLEAMTVPLESTQALYCAEERSVWTAGRGGAAHFDGERWLAVEGEFGDLGHATGRGSTEVWLGGKNGLYRGRRKSPDPQQ